MARSPGSNSGAAVGRGNSSAASARDKILAAADRLFGDQGFDATTTREIAEASGVNKALIHYHFGSKGDLLESLFASYFNALANTLRDALDTEGTPRQRLFGLVDAYVDFLAENRSFSKMVQREASGGLHQQRVRQHMLPVFAMGAQWIEEAFPKTKGGDLSAGHLIVTAYGMIVTYFTYRDVVQDVLGADPLGRPELEQRKAHLRRMVELILQEVE